MKKILLTLAVCLAFSNISRAEMKNVLIGTLVAQKATEAKAVVESGVAAARQAKLEKLAKNSGFKYNCFDKNDVLVFGTNDKDEATVTSQSGEYTCIGFGK